jgi:hypothetical protein
MAMSETAAQTAYGLLLVNLVCFGSLAIADLENPQARVESLVLAVGERWGIKKIKSAEELNGGRNTRIGGTLIVRRIGEIN